MGGKLGRCSVVGCKNGRSKGHAAVRAGSDWAFWPEVRAGAVLKSRGDRAACFGRNGGDRATAPWRERAVPPSLNHKRPLGTMYNKKIPYPARRCWRSLNGSKTNRKADRRRPFHRQRLREGCIKPVLSCALPATTSGHISESFVSRRCCPVLAASMKGKSIVGSGMLRARPRSTGALDFSIY